MKSLKEMKARLAELKSEGRGILDAAEAAKRDLTADEERRFQGIEADIEALNGEVDKAQRAHDRRLNMEGAATPADSRVEVGVDRASLNPTAGFHSLADFATCVKAAHPATPNAKIDPRLSAMYQAAPSGYQREGAAAEGYQVPPEFRDRIWELVYEQDNLMSEVAAEPTNSNQVTDLQDESTPWGSTGVKAVWRSEAKQMSPTGREDAKPRIVKLDELYAFVLASDELLEDAPRLNSRLGVKAAEAIAWTIDEAIINGNGVGKPLGYMRSGALVTVNKEAGQAAGTVVAANLVKMFSRMLGSSIPRAHWRINSDVLPSLITMTLGDQPIWTPPASGLINAPGGMLLGRPVRLSEHNETLGTLGDIQLIDPKGYYALRKEGGVKFATSIHLYFDYGLQAFRWTVRLGGQPHLSAPVSPAKGSTTKSHFVTLEAR